MSLRNKLIASSNKIIVASMAVTAICAVVSPFSVAYSEKRDARMNGEWREKRLAEYKAQTEKLCVIHIEPGQPQPIYECIPHEAN